MEAVHLVLKVKLSLFVTAAVDESSALTLQSVAGLVAERLRAGGLGQDVEGLIDRYDIMEVCTDGDQLLARAGEV